MEGITLRRYLESSGRTQTQLSKEIGVSRQKLNYWHKQDARVSLADVGIRIRLQSGLIVYETMVEK